MVRSSRPPALARLSSPACSPSAPYSPALCQRNGMQRSICAARFRGKFLRCLRTASRHKMWCRRAVVVFFRRGDWFLGKAHTLARVHHFFVSAHPPLGGPSCNARPDHTLGHKQTSRHHLSKVRFTPQSGHGAFASTCPFSSELAGSTFCFVTSFRPATNRGARAWLPLAAAHTPTNQWRTGQNSRPAGHSRKSAASA